MLGPDSALAAPILAVVVQYAASDPQRAIAIASMMALVAGLGQMLYTTLSLFQEAQASTVILGMLVLVLLVDTLSDVLRQRYVRA